MSELTQIVAVGKTSRYLNVCLLYIVCKQEVVLSVEEVVSSQGRWCSAGVQVTSLVTGKHCSWFGMITVSRFSLQQISLTRST